ncbi:MAG TPA: cytochrome P460 family protein [Caulobacteraceae bacterium]|jgi:cytochrome c553
MTRSLFLAAGPAALAALVMASSASGQTAPPDARACAACHGPAGVSTAPATPNLAGQKAGYLEAQLKAFKAKTRTNAFMNPIAAQLGDDGIHALAAYWASLPAVPAVAAAGQTALVPSSLKLPAGFPAGFTQYQDKPAAQGGGRTQRYANAAAIKAAKAGQPLPDGSTIVTVTLDKDGKVASYEAMEAKANWDQMLPPLLRNGDFQYGRFQANGQPVASFDQAACLACHKGKEADSFMFTHKELTEAKG